MRRTKHYPRLKSSSLLEGKLVKPSSLANQDELACADRFDALRSLKIAGSCRRNASCCLCDLLTAGAIWNDIYFYLQATTFSVIIRWEVLNSGYGLDTTL